MRRVKPFQVWMSDVGNVYRVIRPLENGSWEVKQIAGAKLFRGLSFQFTDGFQVGMHLLNPYLSNGEYQKIADTAFRKFNRALLGPQSKRTGGTNLRELV